MRGLFLDQSLSNCGWALFDGQAATSGAWPLAESILRRGGGFFDLRRKLTAIHKEAPLDMIALEAPLKMSVDKVDKLIALYGLIATVEGWAHPKNVHVCLIDQRDWRNSWLGPDGRKGKDSEALKRAAVIRARELGFDPKSHDEAEAIGIMDHVLGLRKITPPWRLATPMLTML